jgi:polyisoprenoid-binding protein YceI
VNKQTSSSLPTPGLYRLDPETTTIRVDTKAMFGLIPVHATFRLLTGEVQVGEETGASSVRATIDAASFASGNQARDRDVTSPNLLDTSTYPEIAFTSHEVRPESTGWVVPGMVTAHGVSATVEIRVEQATLEDGVARFRATARIDRTSFGVTKKKGMVGRWVQLAIEAIGSPT